MLIVIPAEASEVTRLKCPECKEKLPLVGVKKDSRIDGLCFKCKRCGALWSVKTVNDNRITETCQNPSR